MAFLKCQPAKRKAGKGQIQIEGFPGWIYPVK